MAKPSFSEIYSKIEQFAKKGLNIKISSGFWLLREGNGIFKIRSKFKDHSVETNFQNGDF